MSNVEFKNPGLKPIEELVLNLDNEKIPALSARWVEQRSLGKYIPLKLKNGKIHESFEFDEEVWLLEVKKFNSDLEWVLGMSFHRFWSNVLYNKEFLNPLLFFLQESTPFYMSIKTIVDDNEAIVELYEKVSRNALIIVCRLITNRESDTEFMTKEKQAEIIYSNFIISVPMIFDMLTLYGYSNKNLMQKIIDTLLKIEPKYSNDFKMGIKFIQSTFDAMKTQLETIETDNFELFAKYEDLSLYLLNVATTLNLIIDLVPNDIKAYCSRELHLEQAIASFYDGFIPQLYQSSFYADSSAWFLNFINYARVELINCFRSLLSRGISSILNAGEKNRQKFADGVLSTLTECAGYKTFIVDYVRPYPIEMDLDIISQSGKNIEKIKLDFVSDAFKSSPMPKPSSNAHNGYHASSDVQTDDDELEGACALPLPKSKVKEASVDVEEMMQLETSKILELFPHYGVGYIRKLLAFYDNSSENVIGKILEENLDPSFKGVDEQESYIPPEIPDKVFLATGLERSNIYDGDKFDVMRQDEFGGHVKKNGKFITKKEPKTFHELLNDKSHVEKLKERYQAYGLVAEAEEDKEYDDEYDDSYDVYTESGPKMQVRFQGKMRDMLADTIDMPESEEDDDDDPTAPSEASKKNPLDFCENPEATRARREQQFQHKMAKKYPQRPLPQETKEIKTRDVVGNQKGQGQSNEVLRNRQMKSANKSSRANHNRKAGSSFKQSRGMF